MLKIYVYLYQYHSEIMSYLSISFLVPNSHVIYMYIYIYIYIHLYVFII